MSEPLEDLRGYPCLDKLRKLVVHVQSPRGIQKATKLQRLDITLHGEKFLYEVERVKTLEHMTVRGTIESIYGAEKLRSLRELVVDCSATSLPVPKCRNLERLDFTNTPLQQLSWFPTPKLTHLRIRGTAVTELLGLWDTKALRQIELDTTRIQSIEFDTDVALRKLGKQLKIVDGARKLDYAAFAATKQIVTH